jgi:hypothetical protein
VRDGVDDDDDGVDDDDDDDDDAAVVEDMTDVFTTQRAVYLELETHTHKKNQVTYYIAF